MQFIDFILQFKVTDVRICIKSFFHAILFPNLMMDLVYIWYDGRLLLVQIIFQYPSQPHPWPEGQGHKVGIFMLTFSYQYFCFLLHSAILSGKKNLWIILNFRVCLIGVILFIFNYLIILKNLIKNQETYLFIIFIYLKIDSQKRYFIDFQ